MYSALIAMSTASLVITSHLMKKTFVKCWLVGVWWQLQHRETI